MPAPASVVYPLRHCSPSRLRHLWWCMRDLRGAHAPAFLGTIRPTRTFTHPPPPLVIPHPFAIPPPPPHGGDCRLAQKASETPGAEGAEEIFSLGDTGTGFGGGDYKGGRGGEVRSWSFRTAFTTTDPCPGSSCQTGSGQVQSTRHPLRPAFPRGLCPSRKGTEVLSIAHRRHRDPHGPRSVAVACGGRLA